MKRLSKLLLDKSQEAFLLSLEIYNKPTIQYRIESFCFFFTNAWELLLKAYLIEGTKNDKTIFYPKQKGQPQKSISVRDALKRIFPNENDPIRRNIEDIIDLRDEAAHLIIQELESIYVGLFQAGVLNYLEKIKEWFGVSVADKISPAMLSLIFDIEKANPAFVKKKHGKKIAEFFVSKLADIEKNISSLNDKKYSISIEYKLALVKKPKDADITLSVGPEGKFSGTVIRVPKDPKLTHPYRQKDCIELIRKEFGEDIIFNNYDFQSIFHKEKVKGNYKYHYRYEPFGNNAYSQDLVNLIIARIRGNSDYLTRTRAWYKDHLSKKKPRKKI